MISVDLKSLINRLNSFCTSTLEGAIGLCASRSHYEISLEHLLLKSLDHPQSDVMLILSHFDIEQSDFQKDLLNTLEEFRTGNPGKPKYSPLLFDWFQDGWLTASIDLGFSEIRSGALLIAILSNRRRYSGGEYMDALDNISLEELKKDFVNILAESMENPAKSSLTTKGTAPQDKTWEKSSLQKFTIDFTDAARKGDIDPVFGRDREIRQIIDILARRRKNNPIVVGEAGVGKTAVVEGLALQIAHENVPDVMKNVEILGLDLGLLQAGAGVKGEFENRLKSVIDEVKSSPTPVILFIDEAHTLIGAGGTAGGSDAANLLKPALARGELRTVAATTWSEYKKYFEKDPALARRFQPVKLDEPSEEDAVIILRGLKEKYESSHNVYITDEAVVAAAKLSDRYIHGRQLPDKAVDLIDTAAARVKVGLTSRPDVILDIERSIQIFERELNAFKRDRDSGTSVDEERMRTIDDEILKKKEDLKGYEEAWHKEKKAVEKVLSTRKILTGFGKQEKSEQDISEETESKDMGEQKKSYADALKELEDIKGETPLIHYEVDDEVVAQVVADWTGIPMGKMLHDDAGSILSLDSQLNEKIKGQNHAMDVIAKGIRASKSGIGNPDAPLGVFLLVGPSGVGKTETGISIANLLFGGERFMVTINMSEFQEKHTVSRLIGSPPGYVGYGEGGVLTEAVRQRPYSVVLLDEVEKADPEVLNLFYQVFDKGMLSDGEGRTINFKNTIILMTSNLATDIIEQMSCAPTLSTMDEVTAAIKPTLSRHFKPALLARMVTVPFYSIGAEAMREIVKMKLNKLALRLKSSHNMALEYDDPVVESIVERCTEVDTGARNIDHIMNGTLLPAISSEILQRMTEGAMPAKIKINMDNVADFVLDFS